MTDPELLCRYLNDHSENAFAELVGRHLPVVYAAALRQVGGDEHLAEDVAQQVFGALARKAPLLRTRATLTGWLYTAARFEAAKAVRAEQRRKNRERESQMPNDEFSSSETQVDWNRFGPVLDDAMHGLTLSDREAVLLRYFARLPVAEIGAKLGIGENATAKKLERSLEKLRLQLAKRGIQSTATALALLLENNGAVAAPSGMAASIAQSTLAQAAGASLLSIMATIKTSTAILGALVGLGAGIAYFQYRTNGDLAKEIRDLRQQNQRENDTIARLNTPGHSLTTSPSSNSLGAQVPVSPKRNESAPVNAGTYMPIGNAGRKTLRDAVATLFWAANRNDITKLWRRARK